MRWPAWRLTLEKFSRTGDKHVCAQASGLIRLFALISDHAGEIIATKLGRGQASSACRTRLRR